MPASVPAEINDALKKIIESGEGKIVQGESEVLAWADASYRKADAAKLIRQLQGNLEAANWIYEVGGKEGDLTVFSVVQETPTRRLLLGFYVPTDEALLVAWTEALPAASSTSSVNGQTRPAQATETKPAQGSSSSLQVVGTWTNGSISLLQERNTITGATTPSNGSTFKYVFTTDGRFEFVGLMQSTMYGCTTSLFNQKAGRFETDGKSITLIPSKNFWRQQNSCAPNSTKERDYTLERETFQLRTKTDEHGKAFICLTSAKGETCYRREER
ncbi:MAG TPA: hypothetical protein VGV59_16670 [Pyrinomonadaceae bacterium]|nr:hypothetical protein [Pyrinomonadaceae bacterium]